MKVTLSTIYSGMSKIKSKGLKIGEQGKEYIKNFDYKKTTQSIKEDISDVADSKIVRNIYKGAKSIKDKIIVYKTEFTDSLMWKDVKNEIKNSQDFYKSAVKDLFDGFKRKRG